VRLHPELHGIIADFMEIETLLRWRGVSRSQYHHGTASMRRTLLAILRQFFESPTKFLKHLTETKAVVGGVVAVALVLRDVTVVGSSIQVHAATFWYRRLVERLSTCPFLAPNVLRRRTLTIDVPYSVERDITTGTIFDLANGRTIVVYRSSLISPCSALSRLPLTALMTFFTEHTFGCAYPRLTLRRRALLSDIRLRTMSELDEQDFADLLMAGFSFAVSPTAWPEHRATDADPPRSNTHFCLRRQYLCPQQGRFFGDSGSLIALLDPLSEEGRGVRARSIPPFGPMVAWRLLNTYNCIEGCDFRDQLLHEWHTSIPLLTLPSPFTDHPQRRGAGERPLTRPGAGYRVHTIRRSRSVG
ncbi:hypothetical protein C8Q76DRAFT_606786, partial [Earliella scabrosa]